MYFKYYGFLRRKSHKNSMLLLILCPDSIKRVPLKDTCAFEI